MEVPQKPRELNRERKKCKHCNILIWQGDVHHTCLLHRACISRTTLCFRPTRCKQCTQMGVNSQQDNPFANEIAKVIREWRLVNNIEADGNIDIPMQVPPVGQRYLTPFIEPSTSWQTSKKSPFEEDQESVSTFSDQWLHKKVLLIGDSRAKAYGTLEDVEAHPSITLIYQDGAKLDAIFKIINENLDESYDVVTIIGILHDLVELKDCGSPTKKPVLKPIKCDCEVIMQDIELYSRTWKALYPNLCIIWTFPSIPDFDRFNGPPNYVTILDTQLFSLQYSELKNIWSNYMTGFSLFELNQTTFPQRAFKHYYSEFVNNGTLPKFKEELSLDGLHPSVGATIKFWNKMRNFYTLSMNLYNSTYDSESNNTFSCPECSDGDEKGTIDMSTHIFISKRPNCTEFRMKVPTVIDSTVKKVGEETVTEEVINETYIELSYPVSMKT